MSTTDKNKPHKILSFIEFGHILREKFGLGERTDDEALDKLDSPKNWDEMERQWFIGIVLTDVNDIRTALAIGEGKLEELPKGVRSNPEDCVLARALSNGWVSWVGGEHTKLYHPVDGTITEEQINLAADTLRQMGFDQVYVPDPINGYEAEVESLSNQHEHDEEDQNMYWEIRFRNTIPMQRLISWFDNGDMPDFILTDIYQKT